MFTKSKHLAVAVILSMFSMLGIRLSETKAMAQKPGTNQKNTHKSVQATQLVALSPDQIFAKWHASIYTIKTPTGFGTGFALEGMPHAIITCYHVIAGAQQITAQSQDKPQISLTRILMVDIDRDFAVLTSTDPVVNGPPIDYADQIREGQAVTVIGSPEGHPLTLTKGSFSTRYPDDKGVMTLRFDATVEPGSSGSPLFDPYGRVIGIVGRKSPEQPLNYAVSMKSIHEKMEMGTPLTLLSSSPTSAVVTGDLRLLTGIKGVCVAFDFSTGVQENGIDLNTLKTAVEDRLKQNKILILTLPEVIHQPGTPYLNIEIHAAHTNSGSLFIYQFSTQLRQRVNVSRIPMLAISDSITWQENRCGGTVSPDGQAFFFKEVMASIDNLCTAWKMANP